MLNYKLIIFLKYLRTNRVIEEYELLFDSMFDYTKLLNLSDDAIKRIMQDKSCAAIVLYEEINNIKLPDNVFQYIKGLKSKELQKYALKMATTKYIDTDLLGYITSVCEGSSIISSKCAYTLAMSDILDKNDDRMEYIGLVAMSDEDTAIQMRDLLFERGFLDKKDNLELLRLVSQENEYVARYMIKLYFDTNSTENLPILSCAIGETQARYTYEILKNSEVMNSDNGILISFFVAQSEIDDGYRIITLIRDGNYDGLYERVKEILKKDEEDINAEELFKSRSLDKIIAKLSRVSDDKDIKIKEKTYD